MPLTNHPRKTNQWRKAHRAGEDECFVFSWPDKNFSGFAWILIRVGGGAVLFLLVRGGGGGSAAAVCN